MKPLRLNQIKVGTAFIFDIGGTVWVKCRGGFRPGCGGELHACAPHQVVMLCNPANGAAL